MPPANDASDVPESGLGASHFVRTRDGVDIHCLVSGPVGAAGPTLLFVPGFLMPATVWERQIAHFQRTHRVIAMDPRSQGRSPNVAFGHHPVSRGRDIGDVLAAFAAEGAVVIAWSLAVREVVAYIHDCRMNGVPHGIGRLVLVDGHLGAGLTPEVQDFWVRRFADLQLSRTATLESSVRWMFRSDPPPEFLAEMVRAGLGTSEDATLALAVGAVAYDLRDALASVAVPVLAVVTPSSPLAAELAPLASSGGPPLDYRVVTIDAGHALFYDEPERFNAEIEAFLV
jgi:microsomal epoxide hydrolase